MRYMMIMMLRPEAEAAGAVRPEPAAMAKMMKYNEELSQAGVLLSLDGLHPTSKGARVYFGRGGNPSVLKDGPFTEAKEIIGGFWLIQVKNHEEALYWAQRCPSTSDTIEAYVEVRRVFEMEDFGVDPNSELASQVQRVETGMGKKLGT